LVRRSSRRPSIQKTHGSGFFYALLASYALFCRWSPLGLRRRLLTGWSKAQESKQDAASTRSRKRVELARVLSAVLRALMVKDIKTFLRDSTQWSQLFLLIALIVVYLYNFKVLRWIALRCRPRP
jgi:ABC-2 type transport system permease protein